MSIIGELKRRNVFKVAVAYVVVGWLILQVSEILVPALRLPDWVLTATLYFLIVGFFPAVIFAWAFELTPEGIKLEKRVDRAASVAGDTGKKLNLVIIALLSVAVIYLGVDRFKPEAASERATTLERDAPADAVTAADSDGEAVPAPVETAIAVLPFANVSGDDANGFFADGVSEEILNALARAREFKVTGRTSSFAFKGRNEDLRLIGETLNVTHILEGSVRKAGETVRVSAQLIAVEDGFQLWSDTWDRRLDDIFAIQDEIAGATLTQLRAELSDPDRIASPQTDPRAYEKYLTARQLMYTRVAPQIEAARDLLDQALALDESFAPAWAMRGIAAALLSESQYGDIPLNDAQEQLRRFAEKAVSLDEDLAEGWAGLGLYYTNVRSPEAIGQAIAHLERALAINPSLLDASNWLQTALQASGRTEEALTLLEAMVDRDPLYRPAYSNLNFTYLRLYELEKMKALHDRLRPLQGDESRFQILLALYYNGKGDFSTALPYARAAHDALPDEYFHVNALARTFTWLNDWEGVLTLNLQDAEFKAIALDQLGRSEEASIAARKWFETTGQPLGLFQHLVFNNQQEALMTLVAQRWGDVEALHAARTPVSGFGHRDMLFVAAASRDTGREDAFRTAMRLIREEHDRQWAQGIDWYPLHYYEAIYWTLAGDQERAVDHVERMVERNGYLTPRFSDLMPLLKALEGHPRYEAAQALAAEQLNRERVEAGYAPLEP